MQEQKSLSVSMWVVVVLSLLLSLVTFVQLNFNLGSLKSRADEPTVSLEQAFGCGHDDTLGYGEVNGQIKMFCAPNSEIDWLGDWGKTIY